MPRLQPNILPLMILLPMILLLIVSATGWSDIPAAQAALNRGVSGISLAELFPAAVFAAEVPTQAAVTGVGPGERPLRPDEVVAYFSALAAASPRARLLEFGRTHEGRPLVLLAIADEATIADLLAFRDDHAARLDPRRGGANKAAALSGHKAVAWLAYGIHGDELSSVDAAAAVAYRLVAGEDETARRLRDKLVVLIDPCENPDGRSRYLAQTVAFAHRTANPDQDDLSHRTVWPWGRGNHYLFDMNRDWFTMRQPESARSREIAAWLPQLVVDSHEMGANASYLFPPPRHPFNPHLPSNVGKWEGAFTADQAAALDRRGYPYFTGEWNEEFFPGYGSSWASYHGAIGILYEMSRTSGTLVRKRGGTLRTFAQAVEHQTTSSLANLSTLAADAPQILADQIAARRQAVATGAEGPLRCWVFPPDPRHPGRTESLAALLTDQGIEVQVLRAGSGTARGLRDARTGDKVDLALPEGTLLVRLDQPAGYLVRVLLNPHVPMDDVFHREEREYLEKDKGSRLYETTGWSLALGRGVPAFWGSKLPAGTFAAWSPLARATGAGLPAEPYHSLIIAGDRDTVPALLADLLEAGVTVRVARKPFTVADKSYRRGALVIRREGNRGDLAEILPDIVARHGVPFDPVATSRSEAGPDLGGAEFPVLVAPRVGVLTGMPVSPTDYGYIWHLLDQELDLRFSALDVGRFGSFDLSRYNVLVFPPVYGGAGLYRQILGVDGLERLRRWVEAGGTAIGIRSGAALLADKETGLATTRLRSQALPDYPAPVWSLPALEAQGAGRTAAVGLRVAATGKGQDGETAKRQPAKSRRNSPYDVAPVLGAGAAPFAAGVAQGTELETVPQAMKEWLADVLPPGREEPAAEDLQRADARLRKFMPQGVLLRTMLDQEAWLNYGLGESITVWMGRSEPFIATPPVTVAAAFPAADAMHLGGLLWPEAAARLAHTGYATREGVGRGQVILFADHPAFRRWMVESERLLINAIMLGPGLGTRWSSPW